MTLYEHDVNVNLTEMTKLNIFLKIGELNRINETLGFFLKI